MSQPKTDLKNRLKRDVEAALVEEFGDNPKLIGEIEAVLEKVADTVADDLLANVKNPLVRMLIKTALHSTIDKAFGAI